MTTFIIIIIAFILCITAYQSVVLKLVWSEEFNTNKLNPNIWKAINKCNVFNYELQCYTSRPRNVRLKNGKLILEARPERYRSKRYTSGRIEMPENKFGFRFGLFEIRAKLPKGKHLWPAIWMLSAANYYGPVGLSGEIDIMEARGQYVHNIDAAIHAGNNSGTQIISLAKSHNFPDIDFTSDFHTFGLYWSRNVLKWYVDGKRYHTQSLSRSFYTGVGKNPYSRNGQPFDQPFRFIINIAVGGTYFQYLNDPLQEWEARNWPKPVMEVDYIRVYQITNKRKY